MCSTAIDDCTHFTLDTITLESAHQRGVSPPCTYLLLPVTTNSPLLEMRREESDPQHTMVGTKELGRVTGFGDEQFDMVPKPSWPGER